MSSTIDEALMKIALAQQQMVDLQKRSTDLLEKVSICQLQANEQFIAHREDFNDMRKNMWSLFRTAFFITLLVALGLGVAKASQVMFGIGG